MLEVVRWVSYCWKASTYVVTTILALQFQIVGALLSRDLHPLFYSQSRMKSSVSSERMMTMDWQSLDPQMLCQLCWKSFGGSAIAGRRPPKSEPPCFTSVPVIANFELWMAFKELLQGARFNKSSQLSPIIYFTWIDPI